MKFKSGKAKCGFWVASLIIFLAVVCGLIPVLWFAREIGPAHDKGYGKSVQFVIKPNQTTSEVIAGLRSLGVIRSEVAAKIYIRLFARKYAPLPGAYTVSGRDSLKEVLRKLAQPPEQVWVTFPEGWRREQYASRLNQVLGNRPESRFETDEFLELTRDLEGQLFPDTYLIPVSVTAEELVNQLKQNFQKKTGLKMPEDKRVLIIASLIERESRNHEEYRIIAGIIENRLEKGWLLNIDATVQYAADNQKCTKKIDCRYWSVITNTGIDSPFNTYKHQGLPPHPIANPGLKAIRAAQNPEKTFFMFYLHDNNGKIHLAKTLQEHNSNIDKYLRN